MFYLVVGLVIVASVFAVLGSLVDYDGDCKFFDIDT